MIEQNGTGAATPFPAERHGLRDRREPGESRRGGPGENRVRTAEGG